MHYICLHQQKLHASIINCTKNCFKSKWLERWWRATNLSWCCLCCSWGACGDNLEDPSWRSCSVLSPCTYFLKNSNGHPSTCKENHKCPTIWPQFQLRFWHLWVSQELNRTVKDLACTCITAVINYFLIYNFSKLDFKNILIHDILYIFKKLFFTFQSTTTEFLRHN